MRPRKLYDSDSKGHVITSAAIQLMERVKRVRSRASDRRCWYCWKSQLSFFDVHAVELHLLPPFQYQAAPIEATKIPTAFDHAFAWTQAVDKKSQAVRVSRVKPYLTQASEL